MYLKYNHATKEEEEEDGRYVYRALRRDEQAQQGLINHVRREFITIHLPIIR